MITKTMITLFVEENNPLTQYFYNKSINNIQFHQLTCPSCGHSGCLSVHGYYHRSVKTSSGKNKIRICRVICECCSHTHAILLSSMVPYSQTSAAEQISIIDNYETHQSQDTVMNNNPLIDENNIRYIIRNYLKHWKERLLSEKLNLYPVSELIPSCFRYYFRQFMQIKNVPNVLFINTT